MTRRIALLAPFAPLVAVLCRISSSAPQCVRVIWTSCQGYWSTVLNRGGSSGCRLAYYMRQRISGGFHWRQITPEHADKLYSKGHHHVTAAYRGKLPPLSLSENAVLGLVK